MKYNDWNEVNVKTVFYTFTSYVLDVTLYLHNRISVGRINGLFHVDALVCCCIAMYKNISRTEKRKLTIILY